MPHRPWVAALLAAACGLLGCAGDRRRGGSDPLPGPPPLPTPPVAAAGNSTSPAALAQAPPPPLDPNRDLRIGPPPTGTATISAAQPLPPPAPPRPVAAVPARTSAAPRTTIAGGGSYAGTYEQAQAQLTAHGVKWQRLETWGDEGEWKFTCSIPSRQNAFISRTYEARADTYLAAVRAVLEQIEQER